jgi:DNA-binding CsgD family transcriptional regulator
MVERLELERSLAHNFRLLTPGNGPIAHWAREACQTVLNRAKRQFPECDCHLATFDKTRREVFATISATNEHEASLEWLQAIVLEPNEAGDRGISFDGKCRQLSGTPSIDADPPSSFEVAANSQHLAIAVRSIMTTLDAALLIRRSQSLGDFTDPDLRILDEIVECLFAILAIPMRIETDAISAISQALDRIQIAYIVLDDRLRIFSANTSAERLIENGEYFHKSNGVFDFSDPFVAERFRQNIDDMLSKASTGDRVVAIPSHSTGPAITCTLSVRRRRNEYIFGPPLISLAIGAKAKGDSATVEQLQKLGITRAEAELCIGLLNGDSIKSYSQRKGIATATARTHLKRVMLRLGVRRQPDLVRILMQQL